MPLSRKSASHLTRSPKPRKSSKILKSACKVLIFGMGDFYSLGGVQVSLEQLTTYLISRKHEVYLYSNWPKIKNKQYAYKFDKKLKIKHFQLRDNATTIDNITGILSEIDPNMVVLVNSGQLSMVILTAMSAQDIPVVLSERGGDEHNLQFNWFSREQRAIAHYLSDNTHFLMESYRKGLPSWMSRQITCIPSLIEPSGGKYARPQARKAKGRYRVIYAGRLSFEKDVNILIEAFARLIERFPDWDLHIFGAGPDEADLHRQVAAAVGNGPHAGRFVFAGEVDRKRMFKEYCAAHVFVLPSRNEGCPIALREAMARGLPVIGFATASGVNEIIRHGSNGLLVDGGDKVGGLEAALAELMSDGGARARLGVQGIEDVKQYAPDVVLSRWEQLILETAACKGRRQEMRAARYKGVVEVERFTRPMEAMKQRRRVRNLFIFDPTIPLNRLEGVDPVDYALCFGALLFDPPWYAKHYPEVKQAGLNPLAHYLSEGYRLGYRPSPSFDPIYYAQSRPAGTASEAPLVHYYRFGRYAGALPSAEADEVLVKRLDNERLRDGNLVGLMKAPDFPRRAKEAAADWYDWHRSIASLVPKQAEEDVATLEPQSPDRVEPQGQHPLQVARLPAASRSRKRRTPPSPRASVIVPVFNKADYVQSALESALHQSYHNIEVIAVDDGSTDASSEVLGHMALEYKNLTVIHQENCGPSGARNTGLAAATGDFVFFHDADDQMEPDAIANLVKVVLEQDSDIVGGVFRRRIEDREFIVTAFQENQYNINFSKNVQKAYQYSTNFSCCNKLFRKSFFVENKLKFIPGLYMQDIELWLRSMFLTEKFSQTEHVVSTYFQRDGSTSSLRTEKRFQSIFDLVDGLIEVYDVNGWRQFTSMRNHALIQGALYFFVKWKLEEFDGINVSPDLRRLWTLLQRIPTDDLATFYIRKNKGPIAAIFLLARQGEFAAAKAVLERNDTRGHRMLIEMNPSPSPEDIVRHALDLVNWNKIPVSA